MTCGVSGIQLNSLIRSFVIATENLRSHSGLKDAGGCISCSLSSFCIKEDLLLRTQGIVISNRRPWWPYPVWANDSAITDGSMRRKENVMIGRTMKILATAMLAASLLATGAQARGGGGGGGGGHGGGGGGGPMGGGGG